MVVTLDMKRAKGSAQRGAPTHDPESHALQTELAGLMAYNNNKIDRKLHHNLHLG